MSYRHQGKKRDRWRRWVDQHQDLIQLIKLPADVIETQPAFQYLLMHGYNSAGYQNHRPWFELSSLSREEREHFKRLLSAYDDEFFASNQEKLASRYIPGFGRIEPNR